MSSGDVAKVDKSIEPNPDKTIDPKNDQDNWPPVQPVAPDGGGGRVRRRNGRDGVASVMELPDRRVHADRAGRGRRRQCGCGLAVPCCSVRRPASPCSFPSRSRPAWDLRAIFGPRPVVNQPDPTAWDSAPRRHAGADRPRPVRGRDDLAAPRDRLAVESLLGIARQNQRGAAPARRVVRQAAESGGHQRARGDPLHRHRLRFLSVPPPTHDQSWLAQWGWVILQPYLQFMYLVNAYRFYSPEPGPASLLWYYVVYEDGEIREVKVPNREEHMLDPLGQEYTRRLSISESTNQLMPLPGARRHQAPANHLGRPEVQRPAANADPVPSAALAAGHAVSRAAGVSPEAAPRVRPQGGAGLPDLAQGPDQEGRQRQGLSRHAPDAGAERA